MIRYPGSKDKIVPAIIARFPDALRAGPLFTQSVFEYREPFFGAGAVGLRVMQALWPSHAIWINDRDYGIACLWKAIRHTPDELMSLVRDFKPTPESFYRFKELDGGVDSDPVEVGFRKLALHQISFSGLGAKAGGPIGGRHQSSEYNVNCRWSVSRLCRDIADNHRLLSRFGRRLRITCGDFGRLIEDAPSHAFIYADPPYVARGPELYKHSMNAADHQRLSTALRSCRASWVLSYDDHPLVRELYEWAHIERVSLTYTTAVASERRRKNSEVIVSRAASRLGAA